MFQHQTSEVTSTTWVSTIIIFLHEYTLYYSVPISLECFSFTIILIILGIIYVSRQSTNVGTYRLYCLREHNIIIIKS